MYKDNEINIVCRSIEKLRELAKLEEKDLATLVELCQKHADYEQVDRKSVV